MKSLAIGLINAAFLFAASSCLKAATPRSKANVYTPPTIGNLVAPGFDVYSGAPTQIATDQYGQLILSGDFPDGGNPPTAGVGNIVACGYNVDSGQPTQLATDATGHLIVSQTIAAPCTEDGNGNLTCPGQFIGGNTWDTYVATIAIPDQDSGMGFALSQQLTDTHNEAQAYVWYNGPPDGGPLFSLGTAGQVYLWVTTTGPQSAYAPLWPLIDVSENPGGSPSDAGGVWYGDCVGPWCGQLSIGNFEGGVSPYLITYNGTVPGSYVGTDSIPPDHMLALGGQYWGNQFDFWDGGSVTGENGGVAISSVSVGGGTMLNFIGATTCTLSAAQCNAPLAGADGNTHCTCSIDEASNTLVGCNAKADGGSVSAYGPATSTGVATIQCFGK